MQARLGALGALVAVGVFGLSSAAKADWQFTRWGMTVDQVIDASKGTAKKVAGTPERSVFDSIQGAEAPYSALGFEFRAEFYFDATGGLSGVRLMARDADCPALRQAVYSIYGSEGRDNAGGQWTDVAAGNTVRLTGLHGQCFLAYRPISPTGKRGL